MTEELWAVSRLEGGNSTYLVKNTSPIKDVASTYSFKYLNFVFTLILFFKEKK